MHKRKPALSKGGGTTKLSETLKIQAVGAGFLAKSNLCSSEAELEGLFRDIKILFILSRMVKQKMSTAQG